MRRAVRVCLGLTLVASAGAFAGRPGLAGAQSGGAVEVAVTYQGPPQIETLKVTRDAETCGTEAKLEKIVVGTNKGLANAVVSVAGLRGVPTAMRAEIAQHGCRFVPRVVATMPGEIDVRNSDGILHNVHTYSTANPSINKALPKSKKVMTEKLERPEIIQVTCDLHPWMVGWIAVMPHPFFAVTDGRGLAKIEGVPAGKHTIEAWHETLGRQTKDIDVKSGQVAKVSIEMKK